MIIRIIKSNITFVAIFLACSLFFAVLAPNTFRSDENYLRTINVVPYVYTVAICYWPTVILLIIRIFLRKKNKET